MPRTNQISEWIAKRGSDPRRLPALYTLVVLAGVLIIKGLLFRHVGSVGESIGSLAVKSDAWHHRRDAISSAFAFVGISIALLGGPGWEAADDWAALCAGVVILYDAWHQLRPAIFELADIAPDPDITARVRATAASVPGVLGLDKCFVRKMGFSFYVDLHIIVNGELSVREGHRIAHLVENSVLEKLPQISEVLVHVEPEGELAAKGIACVRRAVQLFRPVKATGRLLVATPATNNDGCPSIIISPFCSFGVLAHPVSASISTVLKLQAVA